VFKDYFIGLVYGISYFTTLPINLDFNKISFNNLFYRGVIFSLPLVGGILASIIIFLHILLPFSLIYKSIFLAILYHFLYGFIHLEGFMDTVDGYFASLSNKNIYQIMKEPHIGAIGALVVFSFLLLKILAITFILYYQEYLLLFLVFIFSRISIFFALELEFHKNSSFLLAMQKAFFKSYILKILFFPINLMTKYILQKIKRKFGFLNGDIIGFNIELIELILLNIAYLLLI
jgi:adenosylcobinamide-GDP ribazoletransferase